MPAKVAVICLCYNHERYVQEAMNSVLSQTYPTELIIVDDASSDHSVDRIQDFVREHPTVNIKTLLFENNIGNCKAFNSALALTDADFIIDLAADDVLLPERVEGGLESFKNEPDLAINFSNAYYIDEAGSILKEHYEVDEKGRAKGEVPEGDLFTEILQRYFICSPSMMYRASFLKEMGGYDEELAYEDFDIMLRLSRKHPFSYTDRILVKKRLLNSSMSNKQYKKGSRQLESTLKICKKAFRMIQNKSDKKALLKRVAYESKQAFINKRFELFLSFSTLGFKTILKK